MLRISLTVSLVLAALSAPLSAQCPGQGNLVMTFTSVGNTGTVPGSTLQITVLGNPGQHVCVACTPGAGPSSLFGLATVCLDLSGPMLENVFFLPPSGMIQLQAKLPSAVAGLACCTAIGIDPAAPNGISVSNSTCFQTTPNCDSGGILELGHITVLNDVTSFPVAVTSTVEGFAGGSGTWTASVNYDPANPPPLPVAVGNNLYIENIAKMGDDLHVTTLIRADASFQKRGAKLRLPNEIEVQVGAGAAQNAKARIHVSCSQPIGVGMVFGPYTITNLTPAKSTP